MRSVSLSGSSTIASWTLDSSSKFPMSCRLCVPDFLLYLTGRWKSRQHPRVDRQLSPPFPPLLSSSLPMGTLVQAEVKRRPMAAVGRMAARVKATRAMDLEVAANIAKVNEGGGAEVRSESGSEELKERREKREKREERREKKRRKKKKRKRERKENRLPGGSRSRGQSLSRRGVTEAASGPRCVTCAQGVSVCGAGQTRQWWCGVTTNLVVLLSCAALVLCCLSV